MIKKLSDKELIELIDTATKKFTGNVTELESAIGLFLVARKVGWKALFLVHTKKTIRRYEAILGISIRDYVLEEGELARKSRALNLLKGVTNFWKAVQGEIPGIRNKEFTR